MERLPLHDQHEALGAKFGEFAGYTMPLYYRKPIEEHHTVRQQVGVFDISHMGQFVVTGERAEDFLQYALPGSVRTMANGDALYAPLCREDGGVLDDLIIYRYGPTHYRVIVNAATRAKDYEWLACIAEDFACKLEDISAGWCLLAVQGPQAFERLAPHVEQPPGALKYYSFAETKAFGIPVFLARTGYTGEPGCELAVPREQVAALWEQLTGTLGIAPIGLAARDTLRLEACMALYGHELREEWHPLESGLSWAVQLDGGEDYIGKKALLAIRGVGYPYRLVGLEVTGRGIPREGYRVLHEGEEVGQVTSGALSPTTGKAVALAHIRQSVAKLGTALQVEIREKPVDAVVVRRPFYKNPTLKA
ncbi:MAG TPA: glycine cleavage system aminomethyltransferase GcvT [bacterium]|nr:glycine cleavage system aminomethyltransferase GcvT [bacterium]